MLQTKDICRRLQLCFDIDLYSTCLSELRNIGTDVKTEKAGLQDDHGSTRDFKADAAL